MMQRNNLGQEQYDFVRKLLQCSHAYATLDRYESAFREAMDKASQNENGLEQDGWYKVCVIVDELGVLLFSHEWTFARSRIVSRYAREA